MIADGSGTDATTSNAFGTDARVVTAPAGETRSMRPAVPASKTYRFPKASKASGIGAVNPTTSVLVVPLGVVMVITPEPLVSPEPLPR
jgi:hypothetical protein